MDYNFSVENVAANLAAFHAELQKVCAAVGRDPRAITLVAVSKTQPAAAVNALLAAGVREIGENRVQEAVAKFPALLPCRRHLIGHLQSNKARIAAQLFDVIQSVDSLRLAELLSAEAAQLGKTLEIFLQVNLAEQATQSGLPAADVPAVAAAVRQLPHLKLTGLMAIGPCGADEMAIAKIFRAGRQLVDALALPHFSAGMSADWPIAVAAGATHLRLGSALFGARSAPLC